MAQGSPRLRSCEPVTFRPTGVRATDGPMQHQYGTVVYFREDDGTILVRFGGSQQLYFREDELEPWA